MSRCSPTDGTFFNIVPNFLEIVLLESKEQGDIQSEKLCIAMISEACDIFAKCSHRFGVNTSTWLYSIEDMCRKCMHVKYTTVKYSSNTSGYKFSHFLSCNYLSKLKSVMYYCYRLNLSFTSNACSV